MSAAETLRMFYVYAGITFEQLLVEARQQSVSSTTIIFLIWLLIYHPN